MSRATACLNCGQHNLPELRFCPRCGTFLMPVDDLRQLTWAIGILFILSCLVWGTLIYVEVGW
jgi:hypothetical protein